MARRSRATPRCWTPHLSSGVIAFTARTCAVSRSSGRPFCVHPLYPLYRLGMSDDSRTQFRSGPGLMHLQPLQRAESPHVQRALIVTGIPLDSDWAKSHGATSLAMSSPSARSASVMSQASTLPLSPDTLPVSPDTFPGPPDSSPVRSPDALRQSPDTSPVSPDTLPLSPDTLPLSPDTLP